MASTALFIRHKTLPGKRDDVRAVWLKHMAPAIQANPGHAAYFYCFDTADTDSICAFQHYVSREAAEQFLSHPSYHAYPKEVEPLLSGPPEVKTLAPMWTKAV
jgi:quinol monooxygenase YgiN